jgi:hypothetical protein
MKQRLNRSYGRLLPLLGLLACAASPLVAQPYLGGGTLAKIEADTVSIAPGIRSALEPNIPNPFGANSGQVVTIGYSIEKDAQVDLKVYDFFYDEVLVLVSEPKAAGRYLLQVPFPSWLPSGMYFYELRTPEYRELRRMIYIK